MVSSSTAAAGAVSSSAIEYGFLALATSNASMMRAEEVVDIWLVVPPLFSDSVLLKKSADLSTDDWCLVLSRLFGRKVVVDHHQLK